ncbi:MAG: Holliday junction resolvase RuvX [Bacteroidetes bacterium]|nr:Holliday junction resolvase RuvX [Bacteroidota bacterium]MBS1684256.1 Holliday junction resolvase RuvX [Bacteroidota bacterium]
MARILAFDYGQRRVGVAATDPLQIIASAVDTIETKSIYDWIKTYLAREQVETFVVGWPYNDGFKENPVIPHITKFIGQLQKLYPQIPVVKADESFTSRMAMEAMIQGGMKKKDRQKKENLDKISATIILQNYMESRG